MDRSSRAISYPNISKISQSIWLPRPLKSLTNTEYLIRRTLCLSPHHDVVNSIGIYWFLESKAHMRCVHPSLVFTRRINKQCGAYRIFAAPLVIYRENPWKILVCETSTYSKCCSFLVQQRVSWSYWWLLRELIKQHLPGTDWQIESTGLLLC
jgi:hypothetical protein